jgi:hypothetical protein
VDFIRRFTEAPLHGLGQAEFTRLRSDDFALLGGGKAKGLAGTMRIHNLLARERTRHRWAGVLGIMSAVVFTAPAPAAIVDFGSFPNNSTHSNASVAAAIANVPTNAGVVYDPIGQTNYIQVYNFGTLVYSGPVDVSLTLARIRAGYWMPTETDDGGFFNFNNPSELPNIPRKGNNYYMEFVVWPFLNLTNSPATYDTGQEAYGVVTYPGPMRLLIGLGGEVWFTGDHYGENGLQLNAENVNPPPPPGVFNVTSITVTGSDNLIAWRTVGGETNFVQATTGTSGSYSNNFTDTSPIIVGPGGDLTNATWLDAGAATNFPVRYYRIHLVQ